MRETQRDTLWGGACQLEIFLRLVHYFRQADGPRLAVVVSDATLDADTRVGQRVAGGIAQNTVGLDGLDLLRAALVDVQVPRQRVLLVPEVRPCKRTMKLSTWAGRRAQYVALVWPLTAEARVRRQQSSPLLSERTMLLCTDRRRYRSARGASEMASGEPRPRAVHAADACVRERTGKIG